MLISYKMLFKIQNKSHKDELSYITYLNSLLDGFRSASWPLNRSVLAAWLGTFDIFSAPAA